MIQGYIFDLDGTLVDTLESLAASFNRALVQTGFPTHPVNAYRYFIGDGQRKAVERALPASELNEVNVRAVMAAQQADYAESWRELASPYPQVPEMLDALSARGARLAVLSNKNHPFAVKCVEYFFPNVRFDVIQGYSDTVPLKPDPAGARQVAQKLGLLPEAMAFVGDTATDMLTASACGMTSVGVLWGFRDLDELNDAGARHIISKPMEVLTIDPATGPLTTQLARKK